MRRLERRLHHLPLMRVCSHFRGETRRAGHRGPQRRGDALGYEVPSRTNGREALALLKSDPSRFDPVITDQTMPEMTGIELARMVLAIKADTPTIMCTGVGSAVDADKAKAAGIRAFTMKPLTRRETATTIRKVLDE